MHFIQDKVHVLPRIYVSHSGGMRAAGFNHIMDRCSALGIPGKVVVEILTSDQGFQRIPDNHSWDRVVRKVLDDFLMEDVITVCIRLESA